MTSSSIGCTLPLYVVDAFTSQAFAGNAAGVCLLSHKQVIDDVKMQKIANELNLSETCFIALLTENDSFKGTSRFGLRWFTTACEVPLCGHATLAAATVLFSCIGNKSVEITFDTRSGPLVAKRKEDNFFLLDLPANPGTSVNKENVKELLQALAGDLPVVDVEYAPFLQQMIVRLQDSVSREMLEATVPNIFTLPAANTSQMKLHGVHLTVKAPADSRYDFYSRCFFPWDGLPEDPVCGSAHTVFGCYWQKVTGKSTFQARQCSKRGGDVYVNVRDDNRVEIGGKSVVVIEGKIYL